MKNTTSLLLCLLFLLVSSCSLNNSSIKNDLTKGNLKGDVKLTVEEFESESNKSMKIKEFNEDGYLIREFETNNSSSSLIEYNYDDNKLINRTSTSSDLGMKNTEKSLYEYDKDGRLSMETIIKSNNQRTNEYVYDGNRLIKIIQDKNTITNYFYSNYLDSTKTEHLPSLVDGEEYKMVVVYCYNDKEHLVKEIIRNYHNNKCDSFAVLNKYDSEGNMTSRVTEGKTDSLLISYTYDSKRNWILQKASRGSNIEYISTRKVFYSGDEISSYLKIIDEFKGNLSKVDSDTIPETTQSTNTDNSVEVENSLNQLSNCGECNGTGKCRICSKTFQKPYLKNGYYEKRSETKVGYTLCNLCLGKGFQDRNIGSGYEIFGDCSNQKCQDGWVFCYKCNSSGQRNDIGQCRECRGTGRK